MVFDLPLLPNIHQPFTGMTMTDIKEQGDFVISNLKQAVAIFDGVQYVRWDAVDLFLRHTLQQVELIQNELRVLDAELENRIIF